MILPCNTAQGRYDIEIGRGILQQAGEKLDLKRKVLVVTDEGVPPQYARCILDACQEGYLHVLPQGEASKNLSQWQTVLQAMLAHGFTRSDAVVAVGGGVVGDLAGFAAASYMRGIDFYNVPTTLLSQLDSSVGGKTGVDFEGVKNIVGAFKQPAKVLIDPDCLKTLSPRLLHEGLAEGIKMAVTSDADLFRLIADTDDLDRDLEAIIAGGLRIDSAGALSWGRECTVALAGAAANLLAAVLACVWYARTGRADAACMGGVQLLFACSNLLPLHALDGGQALRALLCRRLPLGTAEGLSRWVSRFFSVAILIFGLYIAFKTRYNSLILVSGSMLLAGNANKAKEANPLWMSV